MTTSAALRQPRSTLMGLRGPPRTQARPPRMGIWFHPTRTALPPPLGHSAGAPSHRPKPTGGPPWPSAPLQSSITGTPCRPAGCPARQTTLPLLGFCGPTTRIRPADPFVRSGSLRYSVPRTGFGYPLRGLHHRPSQRLRAGASMGFTLQGLLLDAIGAPLGALAFLTLLAEPTPLPEEGQARRSRLQGLVPATSSCSHRNHKGSSRRSLPGVHPSRAYSRSAWRSLSSRRLPSRPQAASRLGPPGPQGIAA
jgi:hypothetical protein